MEKSPPHYREVLREELTLRRSRNPSYSLRAFARDLSMPAPETPLCPRRISDIWGAGIAKISEILRGISGVSVRSGARLAKQMGLSLEETHWFLVSIKANHSRSPVERNQAKAELREASTGDGYFSEMHLDRFKIVANWHHFAILELTELMDFSSNPEWIANRIRISVADAREAIQRLLHHGLLERAPSGRLRQTYANLTVPGGVPSREIRNHHAQILRRAALALEEVPITERDFSSITMAISQQDLPMAAEMIREFRRKLDHALKRSLKSRSHQQRDRVFALSVQFFPLDRPRSVEVVL